jgi:hypothetical protein
LTSADLPRYGEVHEPDQPEWYQSQTERERQVTLARFERNDAGDHARDPVDVAAND